MSDNILHIYGQTMQHDDVTIVGNKEALLNLSKLCKQACGYYQHGEKAEEIVFFDTAGEGYNVNIKLDNSLEVGDQKVELPYAEFMKMDWQLMDIKGALEEYKDNPIKCVEEIEKILKGEE